MIRNRAVSFTSIRRRAIPALATFLLAFLPGQAAWAAAPGEPEKDELNFGFVKLTDMAPLAVAYEQGFFEDEGLEHGVSAFADQPRSLTRVQG